MREEFLYPLVGGIFNNLHFSEAMVEVLYEAACEKARKNFTYVEDILLGLQESLQSLKVRESRLLDSYLAEQISQSLYEEKSRALSNERVSFEQQILRVKHAQPTPESTLEPIKKVFLEASRATKEFLEGDDFEKGLKLQNLLWNLSFKNGNIVSYQFKKEFEMIAKSPKTGDLATLLRD